MFRATARRRDKFDLVTALMRTTALSMSAFAAMTALGGVAQAKVSRIIVDKVEVLKDAPGQTTPMEKLRGRAFGELDPQDPANAQIFDLKLAPRNANGKVEYVSVFELTKPTDMSKATGLLWYDLVNRGRPLRQEKGVTQPWTYGHVHLVSGWQGDLAPTDANVTVQVPVANNPDGSPITGVALSRLADSKPDTKSRPLAALANAIPYDAASLDTSKARLIAKSSETRAGEIGPIKEIAATDWSYADCTKRPSRGNPNPQMLCLKDGFDPETSLRTDLRGEGSQGARRRPCGHARCRVVLPLRGQGAARATPTQWRAGSRKRSRKASHKAEMPSRPSCCWASTKTRRAGSSLTERTHTLPDASPQ